MEKDKNKKKHLQYLEVIQKKHYQKLEKNLRQKYSMFTRKNHKVTFLKNPRKAL